MAPHFNKAETMYFLRIMQEVLPLGSVEWETVSNTKYDVVIHSTVSIIHGRGTREASQERVGVGEAIR